LHYHLVNDNIFILSEMRAVILLFLLIISICHRFGLSEEQTNFENPRSKPSYTTTNKKVKSVGQQEYYIPSYSASEQQRPQEFIYPNNFGNAYQFSQYKYANRVPATINQKQWSSTPAFGKSIYRNYRFNSQRHGNSDDNSDEYNSDVITNSQNQNQNTNKKLKTPVIKDKVRDFDVEQTTLNRADFSDNEYKNENNNKLRDSMLGAVMRRKSSLNDNIIHSSALQTDQQRSIPIPLARQQENPNYQQNGTLGDVYFVAIVACVSAVAIFAVIGAGYCFYKVQQSNKAAADVDYPAYGVVGPASKETNTTGNLSPSGDRKLAQSAQMYHYHHQKQQMIASEKAVTTRHTSASDVESDEENEEGEYTVYECPGLAPTGEMEVKNPLFHDDITPVSSPPVTTNVKDK
jgi:hypothetical protein